MAADVEAVVVAGLASLLDDPSIGVATDTPDDLQQAAPFVKVVRIGGADAVPGIDQARIDVDTFGSDGVSAASLAYRVHDLLRFGLVGFATSDGHVNAVTTEVGPSWRPYADTNVRSYGASYFVVVHTK